jgi:hypothetical protein
MADVGLGRGSALLAVWGDMVHMSRGTPVSIGVHACSPRSVHTGYGSSHVDARSIRKYGDR